MDLKELSPRGPRGWIAQLILRLMAPYFAAIFEELEAIRRRNSDLQAIENRLADIQNKLLSRLGR